VSKKARIVTGIIAFLYFSLPYFIEVTDWKPANFTGYAFTFVPVWVYNAFYQLTPLKHFVPFIGLVFSALILWWCLYKITMECYEIYLDIYLDRNRFQRDREDR